MRTPNGTLPGPARHVLAPAGQDWDALRFPRLLGARVLHRLMPVPAVLVAPRDQVLYVMVPVGAADGWPLPAGVRLLSTGDWIALPPEDRRAAPGPYWLGDGRVPGCAHPGQLRAALDAVGAAARSTPAVVPRRPPNRLGA
jgi:hypothetical protein